MPKALFVFSANSYFWEAYPLVCKFRDEGWEVATVFEWVDEEADVSAAKCRDLGCHVVEVPAKFAYPGAAKTSVSEAEADGATDPAEQPQLPAMARPRPFGSLSRIRFFLHQLYRMLAICRLGTDIIDAVRPDAVLTGPFNSLAYPANGLVRAAKRHGIPLYCYPWGPFLGERFAIIGRFLNYRQGAFTSPMTPDADWLNALCAWLYPHWIREVNGLRLFCRDPVAIAAAHLTGLVDHDGWQKPGLGYDKVFVPSQKSQALLRESHYPIDKVVVSGMPRFDAISKRRADPVQDERFWSSLHLKKNASYIVLNVEPSVEHGYASLKAHWDNFNATLECVRSLGVPVILSLHPLCKLESYSFCEEKYGVLIDRENGIFSLISESTFVISYPCSTNYASLVFGKPLIIIDYHGNMLNENGSFYQQDNAIICTRADDLQRVAIDVLSGNAPIFPTTDVTNLACNVIFDIVADDVAARIVN